MLTDNVNLGTKNSLKYQNSSILSTSSSAKDLDYQNDQIVLNKYLIKHDVLGTGTYGKVYRAVNLETQEECAVKIIDMHNQNQNFIQKTIKEVKMLNYCNHPNIIKLFDSTIINNKCYIFQELCNGNLLTLIRKQKKKRFTELQTWIIIKQLLGAISYLHSLNIIHRFLLHFYVKIQRDLKLENVLVKVSKGNTFEVKLADFGEATILIQKRLMLKESPGSLHYMPPEILVKYLNTYKSDMWSLGIITFALLTGNYPFAGKHKSQIVKQILTDKLKFNTKQRRLLSHNARRFVKRLTKKQIQLRLNSIQAKCEPWLLSKPRSYHRRAKLRSQSRVKISLRTKIDINQQRTCETNNSKVNSEPSYKVSKAKDKNPLNITLYNKRGQIYVLKQ